MEYIGKVIKEKRKSLKMTQNELGAKVGACYVSIGHLENGRNVGTDLLKKVCSELKLVLTIEEKEA